MQESQNYKPLNGSGEIIGDKPTEKIFYYVEKETFKNKRKKEKTEEKH